MFWGWGRGREGDIQSNIYLIYFFNLNILFVFCFLCMRRALQTKKIVCVNNFMLFRLILFCYKDNWNVKLLFFGLCLVFDFALFV